MPYVPQRRRRRGYVLRHAATAERRVAVLRVDYRFPQICANFGSGLAPFFDAMVRLYQDDNEFQILATTTVARLRPRREQKFV